MLTGFCQNVDVKPFIKTPVHGEDVHLTLITDTPIYVKVWDSRLCAPRSILMLIISRRSRVPFKRPGVGLTEATMMILPTNRARLPKLHEQLLNVSIVLRSREGWA